MRRTVPRTGIEASPARVRDDLRVLLPEASLQVRRCDGLNLPVGIRDAPRQCAIPLAAP